MRETEVPNPCSILNLLIAPIVLSTETPQDKRTRDGSAIPRSQDKRKGGAQFVAEDEGEGCAFPVGEGTQQGEEIGTTRGRD